MAVKQHLAVFLLAALLCSLAACSSEGAAGSASPALPAASSSMPAAQAASGTGNAASDGEGSPNILIAYFTMPENVDTSGVDSVAGASVVVRDGQALGNTEFMAGVIQNAVGGELFQIETVQQYPLEHEPLVDLAAEEQDAGARPELSSHIEDPSQYDVIFLGYPNWWGDMPQALYTFLEEYDFSGKTIIPFTTHGGSGFSRTISTIAELQPGANVVEQGLSISRNSVTDAQSDVENWVAGLGF